MRPTPSRSSGPLLLVSRRKRFIRAVKQRFLVRFHMALILVGVAVVGLLANKVLYLGGLRLMQWRYPLAVLASYAAFFGGVRLWIAYVHAATPNPLLATSSAARATAALGTVALAGAAAAQPSGNRRGDPDNALDVEDVADAVEAVTEGTVEGVGSVGDAVGSADEGLILLLFAAVVLSVILAGAWLVWQAPVILTEAAFSALLAGAVRRAAKDQEGPSWAKEVLRRSVIPFALVALVAGGAGYGARVVCPQARTLKAALHCDPVTAEQLSE